MNEPRSAAGSPLFLRVFVFMLLCVGVVQLMNLILVVAAQTPEQKLHTIGQIADAVRQGPGEPDALTVAPASKIPTVPANPRAERLGLALSMVLQVDPSRVRFDFPPGLLARRPVYESRNLPRALPFADSTAARAVYVFGTFRVWVQRTDGRWLRVEPAGVVEPWRWFGMLWLLMSVLAVAPFAWALAHRIAKPFGAFAAAAERLGRNPHTEPLALSGPSEIAEAAAAFNQMQARLNRYVDDRTTVIGALAHDLRTPLMRMALRLEAVPDGVRSACENDIRDMQALITSTLAYVRESGQPAARRPLDLRSLAETVTDDLSDRGEPVTLALGDPVVIEGDSAALKAMITNLVSNALKYGGCADVSLERHNGEVRVEVRDRGPGIPPEDIDHVFEPFFRGERSRNRDTGGIGLGLASARAVARAHGGDIVVENVETGGLCARVTLPG
ncbi:ATP-binding protein [Sphingomonas sp. S2-65]|uniref:ATP-binding protein n=1 Tax=Sphingomonas sp. S2-65 TaxID=2903960 RepID=UPI001F3FAE60|nr:ATP-binding protein [Sphingomonas sp. S2-65]UYY58253.1 ATP-binding protein [Sphingomonas sp. S2-65]